MKNKKKLPLILWYAIVLVVIIVIYSIVVPIIKAPTVHEIEYSEFLTMLEEGKIEKVQISSTYITITPKENPDKETYKTVYMSDDSDIVNRLLAAEVKFSQKDETVSVIWSILSFVLPLAGSWLIIFLIFRSLNKKLNGGVMSFGKNTSKIYAEMSTGKTFADVAGQDEAKQSLVEIIDFLNHPAKYAEIGARLPKGALLVGPPGTGKTLLAKAVAGEAKVPFFSISGSEFVEMFVGMGASRVRDLFKQAVENAPCIVFIDEIDTVGKARDNFLGGNDEREQTLNQLLAEMDGFDSSKGVVILAATNRPEVLDKALLRPGRFDRRIIVNLPDQEGRVAILRVHTKNKKMADNIDLVSIAKQTPGASGADLENIINEGALRSVRAGSNVVTQKSLEEAVEVVLAGEEKKNAVLTEKEKRIVAYHETGHALVSALVMHDTPVQKITIIPRTSGALGYTMNVEKEEKHLYTKEEILGHITILAGGRASEDVKFGTFTTGASNDIEKATAIARDMITMYGMSDKFGFVHLEGKSNAFLGGGNQGSYSDETSAEIDREIRETISGCYNKAVDVLRENMALLDKLSDILYEKETITGTEFMKILEENSISSEIKTEEEQSLTPDKEEE